nr:hypothetical protein BaRGS_023022 [Batillaria attramentaria]
MAVLAKSKTGGVSLWTMRHVQDDSQLRLVSTLPPHALPLTRHHILPNPSHGLGGRTLRVVSKLEVDLALGTFTLTPERSRVADPTTAFQYIEAVVVFKKSPSIEHKTFFLQPFQTPVYVALGGCFLSVLVLLLLLERCR